MCGCVAVGCVFVCLLAVGCGGVCACLSAVCVSDNDRVLHSTSFAVLVGHIQQFFVSGCISLIFLVGGYIAPDC